MSRWTPSRYVRYGRKEDRYEWTQTPDEVSVTIKLPSKTMSARELLVEIKPTAVKVMVKATGFIFLEGVLHSTIDVDGSTWTKQDDVVELMLAKGNATKGDEEGHWWPCVVKGATIIDVKQIEGAKYLDDSILKKIWERDQQAEAEKAAAPATGTPSPATTTSTTATSDS
ncbi:hypothetical protein Pelo_1409 [Pelomyxa schiedti]|nr:hypothetical protein Pelo_1409 [Pelomyxa schiedti]